VYQGFPEQPPPNGVLYTYQQQVEAKKPTETAVQKLRRSPENVAMEIFFSRFRKMPPTVRGGYSDETEEHHNGVN